MSGSVTAFPVGLYGYGRTLYFLTFYPNGSSAIDNTANLGVGWTVARDSQGVDIITLLDSAAQIDGVVGVVGLGTVAARRLQAGAISTTNRTIAVRTIDDSSAVQDISANANNYITLIVCVRNGKEM